MLLGRLGANLLANMLVKEVVRDGGRGGGGLFEQVKEQIEQGRIFNDASSFN